MTNTSVNKILWSIKPSWYADVKHTFTSLPQIWYFDKTVMFGNILSGGMGNVSVTTTTWYTNIIPRICWCP